MKIGLYNDLTILRFTSVGAYLGDDDGNEVLLPNKYLNPALEIDDNINVFIYKDSEDRIVATTETPLITLDQFMFLKIKEINFYGAFADWGLEKDLLIPFKEQHITLEEGAYYLTYLDIDNSTDRLYGSTKINKYISKCENKELINKVLPLLVGDKTDLGVKVIVDNKYLGIIYHSDYPKHCKRGDIIEGYIYNIREDGKVDVRVGKPGYLRIDDNVSKLMKILQKHNKISVTDKCSPELVMETVGMSKKVFKQAVGYLYKQRLIRIETDGIVWIG